MYLIPTAGNWITDYIAVHVHVLDSIFNRMHSGWAINHRAGHASQWLSVFAFLRKPLTPLPGAIDNERR